MENITTEYRGRLITFRETDEKWVCQIVQRGEASLAALKKKIDKHIKDESEFKNTPAILLPSFSGHKISYVTITSVTEDGEVWIRNDKNKSREKIYKSSVGNLVTITAENEKIIENIKSCKAEISKKDEEIRNHLASLDRVFRGDK